MDFKQKGDGQLIHRKCTQDANGKAAQVRDAQQRFAAIPTAEVEGYIVIALTKGDNDNHVVASVDMGGTYAHYECMLDAVKNAVKSEIGMICMDTAMRNGPTH